MTRVFLTNEDYAVIKRGDPDEIKNHFNNVRGDLEKEKDKNEALQMNLQTVHDFCPVLKVIKK